MPANYSGDTTGITGHPTVTISEPIGTDVRNSASVRTPLRRLADFLQYVATKAGLLDAENVWAAKQTISVGDLELTNAAGQGVLKVGSGALDLGTKAGNAADPAVRFLVGGAVKGTFDTASGRLVTMDGLDANSKTIINVADPVGDQDADTKAARNAAIAAIPQAVTVSAGTGWDAPVIAACTKASAMVALHLRIANLTGAWTSVATLPAAARPASTLYYVPCSVLDASGGWTPAMASIGSDGTIAVTHYMTGGAFTSPMFAIGAGDEVRLTVAYPL